MIFPNDIRFEGFRNLRLISSKALKLSPRRYFSHQTGLSHFTLFLSYKPENKLLIVNEIKMWFYENLTHVIKEKKNLILLLI